LTTATDANTCTDPGYGITKASRSVAMALESINLEHLPASHTVNAALFRDVKNASFLHQQLLAGNSHFEYAFIDASVVSTRPQPLCKYPSFVFLPFHSKCTPFDIT
jgi:hypothetical protein